MAQGYDVAYAPDGGSSTTARLRGGGMRLDIRARIALNDLRLEIVHRINLVTKGYDPTDHFNLDGWLAKQLALQLRAYLACPHHGTPGGRVMNATTDEEFEEAHAMWDAEVTAAAEALEKYSKHWDMDDPHQAMEDGKAALHWVADNLPALWC